MMNNPTNLHSFQTNTSSSKPQSQPTLSLASSNVVSFTDYTKRLQIINESLSNNFDILGLSETNLTSKQSKFVHKEILPNYYSVFNSASDKCRGTGVALLLKHNIAAHVIKTKGNMGRYIYVDLNFKRHITLRIFQVYLHANPSDIDQRVLIQNEICQEIINAKLLGYDIVLMGDFNFNYHAPDRRKAYLSKKSIFFQNLQSL
jgi:exonuclease III